VTRNCGTCGHDIGYLSIHKNLHTLFTEIETLKIASTNKIVFAYWVKFEDFTSIFNNPQNFDPDKFTSLQRIDREIRNILPPSQQRLKLREEARDHYALPSTTE